MQNFSLSAAAPDIGTQDTGCLRFGTQDTTVGIHSPNKISKSIQKDYRVRIHQ
jgi:hypothetical protein